MLRSASTPPPVATRWPVRPARQIHHPLHHQPHGPDGVLARKRQPGAPKDRCAVRPPRHRQPEPARAPRVQQQRRLPLPSAASTRSRTSSSSPSRSGDIPISSATRASPRSPAGSPPPEPASPTPSPSPINARTPIFIIPRATPRRAERLLATVCPTASSGRRREATSCSVVISFRGSNIRGCHEACWQELP